MKNLELCKSFHDYSKCRAKFVVVVFFNPSVLDVDQWSESGLQFDLVSCLNLLDRCDKPMSLLAQMKTALRPGTGRLLVAAVIPFKPYVEFSELCVCGLSG